MIKINMKKFLVLFSLLLTGCTSGIPEHHFAALNNNLTKLSALSMINEYNGNVLEKANIISSITFVFRGRAMSALGITKLDGENKSFSVAGLNPMAVTLFKLKMDKGKLISSYVIPRFGGGHGGLDKASEAIGRDIARIYFNRKINPHGKPIKIDRDKIFINCHGTYYYIFSGNPLRLIEKLKYENGKKLWSVDYYDYKKVSTKEMPFKIFFKNYKYGYTLDIETSQVKKSKQN